MDAPSKTRLGGIAVVPIIPSPTNWTQHRVFVADANQQAVYATTEWPGGGPSAHNTLNLGVFDRNNILFPTQVAVRPSNVTASTVDLYIAEFLGKIWKLKVPRNAASNSPVSGDGTINTLFLEQGLFNDGPVNVFDESQFTASIRVRKFVEDATNAGLSVNQKVTFEGLQ
jgi:hypothetical protein